MAHSKIRRVTSFILGSFLFLVMRETPWTRTNSPANETPWGEVYSADRKERRDHFFNDLSSSSASDLSPQPEQISDASEGTPAITNLPWNTYEAKGNSESFSRAFLWPVANGRISSGYGERGSSFHEGVDIRANSGAPIRAAADGKVVFSGSLNGYGKTIVIYHGDGISTVYAHNSQNIRETGERVLQGQLIGYVGQTGRAHGSHLHFEVRRSGRSLNPLSYSFTRHPLLSAQNNRESNGRN